MKPYYSEDGITIYHGDCREVLPECDAVLSDPPYGIAHTSSHGASWEGVQIAGDEDTTVRDFVWNHYASIPRAMFGISWRRLPPPGVRCVLIWDKDFVGCGDLRLPWKPSWEEIYIAGDGWEGSRDRGVLRGPAMLTWESGPAHDGNGRLHPHQKPTWIFAHLINKLPHVDVILDPFMGSGTTLRAAKDLGRKGIGIEINESYCEIAAKRLSQRVLDFTGA